MWTRNDTRPTRYRGILFRSGLEAKVAAELDDLGVSEWQYERPWSKTLKLPHDGTRSTFPTSPSWLPISTRSWSCHSGSR